MARQPKPWWHSEKGCYFVTINGVRHRLSSVKKEAMDQFHKLMSDPVSVPSGSVWEVFEGMLDYTMANRAYRTYEFYLERLQRFKDEVPNMSVSKLTPEHVYDWLKGKNWSDTYKRGCIVALCRAFNWAVNARKIAFSPLKGIEKPEASHRETLITQNEFDEVLTLVKDEAFRDILTIIWLTGCRPPEAARVESRHVKPGLWEFPKKESKGKKKSRVVFLVPQAEALTKKWMERFPDGPIFRNSRGQPWRAGAFSCRFYRLKEKVGRKLNMYAIRHSYAHHALTKGGVDPVVVATLLGHSSTNMIYKVYGHLLKDTDFMRKEAAKVRQ